MPLNSAPCVEALLRRYEGFNKALFGLYLGAIYFKASGEQLALPRGMSIVSPDRSDYSADCFHSAVESRNSVLTEP